MGVYSQPIPQQARGFRPLTRCVRDIQRLLPRLGAKGYTNRLT
jgi:hypothetical protein